MTDLERIARILCEADGCDPDTLVFDLPMAHDKRGRIMASIYPPVATWTHYIFLVRATLEAVMTGAENTDLHAMLQQILDEVEASDADGMPVEDVPPSPPKRPNWRVLYGLEQQP